MKQSTQFQMSQSIAPTGVSNPPEFPLRLVKSSPLNPENPTIGTFQCKKAFRILEGACRTMPGAFFKLGPGKLLYRFAIMFVQLCLYTGVRRKDYQKLTKLRVSRSRYSRN